MKFDILSVCECIRFLLPIEIVLCSNPVLLQKLFHSRMSCIAYPITVNELTSEVNLIGVRDFVRFTT